MIKIKLLRRLISVGGFLLLISATVACSRNAFDDVPTALPAPRGASADLGLTTALSGHLYVAGFITGCAGCPKDVVERYRVVNGQPVVPADLVYKQPFAEWHHIAIAPSYPHDLYESASQPASQDGSVIFTYAPGITTPLRTLIVPWRIMAIAIDSQGHLFVGVVAFYNATTYRIVVMYPPGASGNTGYNKAFIVAQCPSGFSCVLASQGYSIGLALDAQGELVVSVPGSATPSPCAGLCVYASAATDPHIAHTISGTGVTTPLGLAVDDKNELFVDNPAYVSAFHRALTGNWVFDRKMSVAGVSQISSAGIAASSGRLFVAVDLGATPPVYDMNALIAGSQTPTVLHAPNPEDAKLGP